MEKRNGGRGTAEHTMGGDGEMDKGGSEKHTRRGHGETHMCRTDKSTKGREGVTHEGEGAEKQKIFVADRHMDGQLFMKSS